MKFQEQINAAEKSIELARMNVEAQILRTPTGDIRNRLCDANIHLQAAYAQLNVAILLADGNDA